MWSNPMRFIIVYLPMANVVVCGSYQGMLWLARRSWHLPRSGLVMVMVKGWLTINGCLIMINEWMINGWFSWWIKLNGKITNISIQETRTDTLPDSELTLCWSVWSISQCITVVLPRFWWYLVMFHSFQWITDTNIRRAFWCIFCCILALRPLSAYWT